LIERLGFFIGAHLDVEPRQVIEAYGGVGVVGPERLSADLERLLIERFGLGVGADDSIKLRQVIEAGSGVGVLGPERLLACLTP
jgi:hypothetical protein